MINQWKLIKKVLFIQPISNEDDPNLKGSSSLLCIPDFSGAVSNGIHLSWIITVYFSFSPIALVVVNIIDSCTIPLWRIFWHCFTDLDNISVFVFGCLGYCEDCSCICIYTLFSYYAICAVCVFVFIRWCAVAKVFMFGSMLSNKRGSVNSSYNFL